MSETTNTTTAALATQSGVLPLRSLQLIGVMGPPDQRRALIRTSAGQIRQVRIGDTLRQGKVVAIGEDSVILSSATGARTLAMPAMTGTRAAA